jgi:hypothetical protein
VAFHAGPLNFVRLHDVPAFVVVAWLHWASYIGGAMGLVAAIVHARRRRPGAHQPMVP